MKKASKIFAAVIMTLSLGFAVGCHKQQEENEKLPVVETSEANSITNSTAICGGVVTSDGGSAITERGVCWSKDTNPLVSGSHLVAEGTTGTFSCNLSGLEPNTTYYVKAYASNSEGVAYGSEISFVTLQEDVPPVVSVMEATGITDHSAMCRASVADQGSGVVVAKGFCWSTEHNPTMEDACLVLDASDPFEGTITRLQSNTLYYLRAYAINSSGVGYSSEISFTTMESQPPTVTVLEGDGYLVDGQVIDYDVYYYYGFDMYSSVGLESAEIMIDDYTVSSIEFYGLTEYCYTDYIYFTWKKEIVGECTIKAIVTDLNGETNSASIRVLINANQPLEPWFFEWNRSGGSPGTGLEEFGLKWEMNSKDIYARIRPLDGVTLFQFDAEVWDEVNTTDDKANLFSAAMETMHPLTEYANVSVTMSTDYDDVIGTILPDGTKRLIHITYCDVYFNYYNMTEISITGDWK